MVALVRTSSGSKTCYGVLTDRLGSLMSLYTSGGIVQKFSYDAWGNRRDPLTGIVLNSSELASANSITSYGYTGHEHIDEFGLINMNARIYDPKIGMFISVDPQAGSYPGTYPYTYCGGDPVNRVDPTGEDYWSTSDPNVIYEFWKHYNENKGIIGYGFDGWYQMSDKEFLTAYDKYGEASLTYNDQTSKMYFSKGKVVNGEVVIYGGHVTVRKGKSSVLSDVSSSLSVTSTISGVFGDAAERSNATFRLKNSEKKFDFRYYKDGWKGNKYYKPSSVSTVGKYINRGSRVVSVIGTGIAVSQFWNANTIEEQVVSGLDLLIDGVGYFPVIGTGVSLYWNFGGKQLHYMYVNKGLIPQIKMGINPGLPVYQPFK